MGAKKGRDPYSPNVKLIDNNPALIIHRAMTLRAACRFWEHGVSNGETAIFVT